MRREKRVIRAAVLEEPADDREREREIRSRLRRDVEVGPLSQPRAPRVHDDEPRAPVLRLEDVRHDVDARDGRVDAPEHDQARMPVVLEGDARHGAVKAGDGAPRGRGADRAGQARGPQAREEPEV